MPIPLNHCPTCTCEEYTREERIELNIEYYGPETYQSYQRRMMMQKIYGGVIEEQLRAGIRFTEFSKER